MSRMLLMNPEQAVVEESGLLLAPPASIKSLVSLLCTLPDGRPAKDLVSRTVRRVDQIRDPEQAACALAR
jgi:hypothetical protein